jgi:GTPase SAR1 family protein
VGNLISGSFHDETQLTVGVQFKTFPLTVENQTINLQIWDTLGQERFKAVSKVYFRNAVGGILLFDLNTLCPPNSHIILVGSKTDLVDSRKVVDTSIWRIGNRKQFLDDCQVSI